MGRKNKKVIARILAVIVAFTLLPFDLWGSADVVVADEMPEEYTAEAPEQEEDIAAAAEHAAEDEQQDTVPEKSMVDEQEGKTETATLESTVDAQDEKTDASSVEEETDAEEEEETSAPESTVQVTGKTEEAEEEKESSEIDNKATEEHVHNFTTNGTDSSYYQITGNLASNKGTVSYNGLTLTQCLKLESATNVKFTAEGKGTLTLVFVEPAATIKIDGTKYTASGDGIITNELIAGEHTITKANTANLFYIIYAVESGDKAATPTATPADGATVKVGDTITLSCGTSDVTIYYTTDESDPKTSDTKKEYNNGIEAAPSMVNENNEIVIKAYAVGDNYAASDVASFTYTAQKGDNQLDSPTAEPDDSKAVVRGTEVILKSNDANASIYYTFDETLQLTKDNGTLFDKNKPIVINEDTMIYAIAVADGKTDSLPAIFEYTVKTPKIAVADDSKNIISSVELKGDVIFKNESNTEVFDIKLSAQNASVSAAITEKAESIRKDGGEILSYQLSLVNQESTGDQVSLFEGTLDIKMLYAIASSKAGRKNEITVLQGTEEIAKIRKDVDGIFFNIDSVADPFTVIINPVPVEDEDETAPKTYILDPEELAITGDLTTDTKYGTKDYFTVVCTSDKKAAIVEIGSVTTGSGASVVNC